MVTRSPEQQADVGRELVDRMAAAPPARMGPRSLTRATQPEINLWELWAKGWRITPEECDALQADVRCHGCSGRADECKTWLAAPGATIEPEPLGCCGRCTHLSLAVELEQFKMRARPLPMIELIMRLGEWRPRAMRARSVDGALVVELHGRDGDWHRIGVQRRAPELEVPF